MCQKTIEGTSAFIKTSLRKALESPENDTQYMKLFKLANLGSLAGGITHTLNNILGGILGYAQLLKEELEPSSDQLRQATVIEQAARRASTLISQIQFYAQNQHACKREVDPKTIVADIVAILESAVSKDIVVTVEYAHNGGRVNVDVAAICHALLNISINSLQAMAGEGELKLRTHLITEAETEPEEDQFLMIEISDSGPGMNESEQKEIFEPFYSTRSSQRSAGLGLPIARYIVHEHGGRIDCHSESDVGTTFTVFLPVTECVSFRSDQTEQGQAPTFEKEMIMIVDDEYDLRLLAKRLLEKRGHRVVLADSGQSAIEVFQENADEISVVILDMIMPGVDGKTVYEKLKNIRKKSRFILTSGHPNTKSFQEILDRGEDLFVPKPWDLPKLLEEAEKALNKN